MDLKLVHTALNVLQACVSRVAFQPQDILALRRASVEKGEQISVEEMARLVIENYLDQAKAEAVAAGRF
jgi:hypothetical protein